MLWAGPCPHYSGHALILTPPLRLAVEELECGQGQTSFVPLSSWVTLGKLSMSSLPKIHTHLESQIVVVPYVEMGSLQMSAVKDL